MLDKYVERIPHFNGSSSILIEEHLYLLWKHMEHLSASNEYVYMRGLYASLEGDAREWLYHFPLGSIIVYEMLINILIIEWLIKLENQSFSHGFEVQVWCIHLSIKSNL